MLGFPGGPVVKNPPLIQGMQKMRVQSLDPEHPLEKEMAIHPSILAQKFPWTEEPDGLHFMGLQRVRSNFTSDWSNFTKKT